MYSSQAVHLYPLAPYHLLKNFSTLSLTSNFQNLLVERIEKFPIPVRFCDSTPFCLKSCDRLFEGINCFGTGCICVAVPTLH